MAAAMIEAFGLARYLEGPVTVLLAIVGPGNLPCIARALACRVVGQEMQIFINGQDKMLLQPPPAPGASIAVVTCLPSTLQTYQFKGPFVHTRAATPAELDWIAGSIERMVIEFKKVDYGEDKSRAYLAFEPEDLVVLSFQPTTAFEQTPGPNAGTRLCGGAQ